VLKSKRIPLKLSRFLRDAQPGVQILRKHHAIFRVFTLPHIFLFSPTLSNNITSHSWICYFPLNISFNSPELQVSTSVRAAIAEPRPASGVIPESSGLVQRIFHHLRRDREREPGKEPSCPPQYRTNAATCMPHACTVYI
jgi:hypothetical protein